MNIAIPYTQSRWQDQELRYCLRSIEKYLRNVDNIYLVGDCPNWVRNVFHLPCGQGSQSYEKEANVFHKLMHYCNMVGGDFLYMNDDHYLLREYDAAVFPLYHGDWPEGRTDMYGQTIENTLKIAPNSPFADVHCPMLMNARFFTILAELDWTVKAGYCMKSLYSRWFGGHVYTDLKIKFDKDIPLIAGRDWFSIADTACTPTMLAKLNELYPDRSRYEK